MMRSTTNTLSQKGCNPHRVPPGVQPAAKFTSRELKEKDSVRPWKYGISLDELRRIRGLDNLRYGLDSAVERRPAIDHAPAALDAGGDGGLIVSDGLSASLKSFKDRVALARVVFDDHGNPPRIRIAVDHFRTHKSEK
jgi:hypothetical protein